MSSVYSSSYLSTTQSNVNAKPTTDARVRQVTHHSSSDSSREVIRSCKPQFHAVQISSGKLRRVGGGSPGIVSRPQHPLHSIGSTTLIDFSKSMTGSMHTRRSSDTNTSTSDLSVSLDRRQIPQPPSKRPATTLTSGSRFRTTRLAASELSATIAPLVRSVTAQPHPATSTASSSLVYRPYNTGTFNGVLEHGSNELDIANMAPVILPLIFEAGSDGSGVSSVSLAAVAVVPFPVASRSGSPAETRRPASVSIFRG